MDAFTAFICQLAAAVTAEVVNVVLENLPAIMAAIEQANTPTQVDAPPLPKPITDGLQQELNDAIRNGKAPAPGAAR